MVKMVKRIHHITFYALLMSVYTVFFSVQFFFNFDFQGSGNAQNFLRHFCSGNHPEKMVSFVKGSPSHSSSCSIRLNKRFHQESTPTCDIIFLDVPEPYIIQRTLGHYRNSFLPSVTPVHRLLRGPPSMA
jgi:hypothetical protein